jgi:hypothetical protein
MDQGKIGSLPNAAPLIIPPYFPPLRGKFVSDGETSSTDVVPPQARGLQQLPDYYFLLGIVYCKYRVELWLNLEILPVVHK